MRLGRSRYGTPTVNPPKPQGIDDYSGFKKPLEELKKDWKGLYTTDPDRRNPQDFLRGVKDNQNLPFARPETPNSWIAVAMLWENDAIMTVEGLSGNVILSEGLIPGETL